MTANWNQSQFDQDLEINAVTQTTVSPVVAQPSSPYSAFTTTQKRWIVAIVAFTGGFSSLTSFIYFPAIPFLAADLAVSTEQINLTVTAYLIMSGIFPSVVGNAADALGRRPVFIVTLAVYIVANIGLALQSSFGVLFFLRIVQSAGISGAYVVTYGVVGDLFTPSERGGYSGTISFFLNTPPCIAPVISGLLMQRWGWRSIFWFLSAISPCCLLIIVLFLPETSRRIVGDGSVTPKGLNRVLLPFLMPSQAKHSQHLTSASTVRSGGIPNPFTSLALLRHPGTAIIIASVGIYFTLFFCLQASLSTLFTQIYKISSLVSGLTYQPFGVACAISAFVSGMIQ
jgi:MFS family permease